MNTELMGTCEKCGEFGKILKEINIPTKTGFIKKYFCLECYETY